MPLTLLSEIAGDERALRHLITETQALTSKIHREKALEILAQSKLHHVSTTGHPAVAGAADGIPHGERFPDISSYQPGADLTTIHGAKSIRVGDLLMVKVSEGTGWSDPYGNARWHEMTKLDYPHRGAYHFFHPSESPSEQAAHMLAVLHGNGGQVTDQDILVCDCEVSDGAGAPAVASGTREFGDILRHETPAKLWLYGSGPFLSSNGVQLTPYDAHWLAAYVGDPVPYMCFGRARTVSWQYSDGVNGPSPHVCPGIGPCDMSIIL
jgi:lysozyme